MTNLTESRTELIYRADMPWSGCVSKRHGLIEVHKENQIILHNSRISQIETLTTRWFLEMVFQTPNHSTWSETIRNGHKLSTHLLLLLYWAWKIPNTFWLMTIEIQKSKNSLKRRKKNHKSFNQVVNIAMENLSIYQEMWKKKLQTKAKPTIGGFLKKEKMDFGLPTKKH